MKKLLFYGQIWLLTHQGMTEVFPFYFNQLSLKNTVNSISFLIKLKDRVVGNRVIFAYLIYFLFARIDANKDYTFIPKISKIIWMQPNKANMNEMDCDGWNELDGLWTEGNNNETWTMKYGLKEMRWNMNNEVDNVTPTIKESKTPARRYSATTRSHKH